MDPSEIDIIATQDQNGLNAGSFFIRNTPTMRLFVSLWSDPLFVNYAHENWVLRDQDLLVHLIFQHPKLRQRIGWVDRNVFNAYAGKPDAKPYAGRPNSSSGWREGDLVIHFPSCG